MAVVGGLEDLSAVEIMQILALGKKSGILVITSDNEQGQVFFDAGKAVHAECGEALGEDAVYHLLLFEDGFFEYDPCEIDCEFTIFAGTEGLIMEAMRRADERALDQRPVRPGGRFPLGRSASLGGAREIHSYYGSNPADDPPGGADDSGDPDAPVAWPQGSIFHAE